MADAFVEVTRYLMDWHEMAFAIGGVLLILFGAVLKTLWDATQKLARDLKDLETGLPDKYLRRDDFGQFREELMATLRRIEAKLDDKVDKP